MQTAMARSKDRAAMKTATVIQMSIQRMICTGCGAEANASCNCGVAYVPAAQRVAEYDKANPGQSTRQAAADLGVDKETVRKARSRGDQSPPAAVTGRDGKLYPAKKSKEENEAEDTAKHNRAAIVIYAGTAIDLAERITSFADLEKMTDEAKEIIHRTAVAWADLDAKVGSRL
jgi:hypothetical protein